MRRQINFGKSQKDPSKPKKNYSPIKIILVILLVTNLMSFMVWQNVKGLELDKRLQNLEQEHHKLQNLYQSKLLEYETIRTSNQIEKIAREKLGMINSKRQDFIRLGIESRQKLIEKFFANKKELDNLE